MPRYSPPLSWTSGTGPDPELNISDEQWARLENQLGAKISCEARSELVNSCLDYMLGVAAEKNVATEGDVERIAKTMEKKSEPFFQLLSMYFDDRSDAWSEFENRFEKFLKDRPIRISFEYLLFDEPPPPEIADWLENRDILFRINSHIACDMAGRVLGATIFVGNGNYRNKNLDHLRGFRPGNAWRGFLRRTKAWAKAHGLPRGEYRNDGTADKLPCFIFALNGLFPDACRHKPLASPGAVAAHMRQARRPEQIRT